MTQPWIEGRFEDSIVTTTWSRRSTGRRQGEPVADDVRLACCAIEMMSAGAGRFDLDRFGPGRFGPARGSPT